MTGFCGVTWSNWIVVDCVAFVSSVLPAIATAQMLTVRRTPSPQVMPRSEARSFALRADTSWPEVLGDVPRLFVTAVFVVDASGQPAVSEIRTSIRETVPAEVGTFHEIE